MTKQKRTKKDLQVQKGREVAQSQRIRAREQIMARLTDIIRDKGLTQKQTSVLFGIPQSKVSCLMNGKLSMFSLDCLFKLLNALDRDVEIIIKPKLQKEKFAKTNVLLASQL